MSRSFKKPVVKQNNYGLYKNYYNARIRNIDCETEIPSGGAYKKFNGSYEICDLNSGLLSERELIEMFGNYAYRITNK